MIPAAVKKRSRKAFTQVLGAGGWKRRRPRHPATQRLPGDKERRRGNAPEFFAAPVWNWRGQFLRSGGAFLDFLFLFFFQPPRRGVFHPPPPSLRSREHPPPRSVCD